MKIKLIVLFAALALFGCSPPTQQEIAAMQAENQTLSSNPTLVATTSQGNLYLIFVRPFPKISRYDRIYFFDTNATVSINHDVSNGKITVTETEVIVNGKRYVPNQ